MQLFSARLVCYILFASVAWTTYAQSTVTLTQSPLSPGKPELKELWLANITNHSTDELTAFLVGTISSPNGIVYQAQSNTFSLRSGNNSITASNFPGLGLVTMDQYDQAQAEEGTYTWCLQVVAYPKTPLAENCRDQIVGFNQPPRLAYPFDGDRLTIDRPTFTWLPPAPIYPGQDVTYTIRIVEAGQQLEYGQIPVGGLTHFFMEGVRGLSLLYPAMAQAFNRQKNYAWQVEAFSKGRSLGKSEIWTFGFGNQPEIMVSERDGNYAELRPGLDAGYYLAKGLIKFRFDRNYAEDDVFERLKITNPLGNMVDGLNPENLIRDKENCYTLFLPSAAGFEFDQYYILSVTNSKGLVKQLRFRYSD